ncbi:MAG TPA: type VI secretion system baseplate subunit TssF [Paraburkholderia sp.]|nr:type VI secretion system baseplate subunit TssF [Paraburkholderia sp.]
MDEFEKLLPYFERELTQLRHDLRKFEAVYPKAAARLSMSGGQTDDPHVERMLQSAAWLNARKAGRVDDHYPEFAEALIETVFPAYLRSIPSCSVAQFDISGLFDGLTRTVAMPHGTELEHQPSLCRFRTAWDVTLAPLAIARAQFSPPTAAPPLGVGQLSGDVKGIVSIEFASPGRKLIGESEFLPQTLRLYLHADRFLAATLTDAMLLRPHGAFVEADGSRKWHALGKHPAAAVGFDDEQALISDAQNIRQPALRLLIEYAAFAYKFRFVDIDLAALLRTTGPCDRLSLHLPVATHATDVSGVERLSQLNANHLRLFCTPVINRFHIDAKPIDVAANVDAWPVAAPAGEGASAVIQSIDSVRMMYGVEGDTPGAEIPPYRSLQHCSRVGVFWQQERDDWAARQMTGSETAIRLIDLDGQPVTPDASRLAARLTCTNGEMPASLAIGAATGDLHSETLNLGGPIAMLVSPTASTQAPRDDQALWRLVSILSPNNASLSMSGLGELNEVLHQLAKVGPPDASRHIAGITGLRSRLIRRTMHVSPVPTPLMMPGVQITLTIDEVAFAGHALHTFAQLMERYFLRYAGWDCMELVITSQRGVEIWHGEPRLGPQEIAFL